MKLLAWLRTLLRRPAPSPSAGPLYRQPLAPAQQATNHLLPLVPVPPPTPAQRLARTQARSVGFGQHVATSPTGTANPLLAELRQLDMELAALRFDLAEAQGMS